MDPIFPGWAGLGFGSELTRTLRAGVEVHAKTECGTQRRLPGSLPQLAGGPAHSQQVSREHGKAGGGQGSRFFLSCSSLPGWEVCKESSGFSTCPGDKGQQRSQPSSRGRGWLEPVTVHNPSKRQYCWGEGGEQLGSPREPDPAKMGP